MSFTEEHYALHPKGSRATGVNYRIRQILGIYHLYHLVAGEWKLIGWSRDLRKVRDRLPKH